MDCISQSSGVPYTGTYALKPPLPAVGGNEGVGEVTEVGSDVQSLVAGDQVVLRADQCLGNPGIFSTYSCFENDCPKKAQY